MKMLSLIDLAILFDVYSQDQNPRKLWNFRTALSVSTNYSKIPKNTTPIFLTFRNHVKIFLSRNIMQIF